MTVLPMPKRGAAEPVQPSPVTLRGFLWQLQTDGKAINTRAAYQADIVQFMEFLQREREGRQLIEAERDDVKAWVEYLLATAEGRSVRRKLSALRQLYHSLLLTDPPQIMQDPTLNIEPPEQWKRLPRYLGEAELAGGNEKGTLQAAAAEAGGTEALSQRDMLIIELLYGAGLRVSELVGLRLEDLKLNAKLEGIEGRRSWAQVHGKGDKERLVPLGGPVVEALAAYRTSGRLALKPGNSPLVFIGQGGKPLTRQRVWQIVKRAGRKVGIDASPHTLRHSCATHMISNGSNLIAVRDILGHATVDTTQIYTHMSLQHLKDVYRKFHPRAQRRKEPQP